MLPIRDILNIFKTSNENKKFDDETTREFLVKRDFNDLIEFRHFLETWKDFYIRINKLYTIMMKILYSVYDHGFHAITYYAMISWLNQYIEIIRKILHMMI